MDRRLIVTFAVACGLAAGNLYYAQPLLGVIGHELGTGTETTSLVVTLTQLGYAFGLVLLVPLGDLFENRALIRRVLWLTSLALLGASWAPSFELFALASLTIGFTSVVAQVLVPFAAHLAKDHERGRVVGQVMSGLLAGILLARAVSGLVAEEWGWRNVFRLSAVLLVFLNLWLGVILPRRQPTSKLTYKQLLKSLGRIFLAYEPLRRRTFYHVTMFGSFSAFWTGLTFWLSGPPWHYGQAAIGRFALVGAVGALSAPWFGRQGDAGRGRPLTGLCLLGACLGFALTLVENLPVVLIGTVLLDACVQGTLVLGQQVIYQLDPEQRSRINTIYIASFFLGGAASSALSGWAFSHWGWHGVVGLGCALPLSGFLYWLTEKKTL
ncbi:MAG: MFS transporter [Candidatus Eremiobacteraeota bacterium]|nr:MFS transporter [Candidatus Eremiobacteraeota bacterium]